MEVFQTWHESDSIKAFQTIQASFKIQGAGVTPFSTNNQNLVINAFAAVMTSVSRADMTARYFTSDDSNVPVFSNSRRRLLQAPVIKLLQVSFSSPSVLCNELI